MSDKISDLLARANHLFGQKSPVDSLRQEIALHFYPERAQFTTTHWLGEEFAKNLSTSYPLIVRRDLANGLGGLLRPKNIDWFKMSTARPDRLDHESKQWLEWATGLQRRAMYDKDAGFAKATKGGDHDYATFGDCVIQIELNLRRNALLYRNWHTKDVAWTENEEGKIDCIYRRWNARGRYLIEKFGGKVARTVKDKADKDPNVEVQCMHIVMPSDGWEYTEPTRVKTPYVSIYIDVENRVILEEKPVRSKGYVIPRWFTPGTQYAYSPAVIAGLPDGRLLQAMTLTLLRAAEKAVDPPMVASEQAIRGDVSTFPGGITWVAANYGGNRDPLTPLTSDKGNFPIGLETQQDIRNMLSKAFYLDKLRPPILDKQMTAYEYSKLIEGWILDAAPLFEPTEDEYNGELCSETFEILYWNNAFGDLRNLPKGLMGQDIQYTFESPLHQAIEKQKPARLLEAIQLAGQVQPLDNSVTYVINAKRAFRDAVASIIPPSYMRSESEVDQMAADEAAMDEQQQMLANLQAGADVAKTMTEAGV